MSVCLSVCSQDYSKTTDQTVVKLSEMVGQYRLDFECRGQVVFLRIVPFEIVVESQNKNYSVIYSVL